jgi:hypothetical protein
MLRLAVIRKLLDESACNEQVAEILGRVDQNDPAGMGG